MSDDFSTHEKLFHFSHFFFSFFRMAATVCLFCFVVGLIFCTGAGEYWLKMFDSFAGTIGLVVIALLEMLAVVYIYGHEKYVHMLFIVSSLLSNERSSHD